MSLVPLVLNRCSNKHHLILQMKDGSGTINIRLWHQICMSPKCHSFHIKLHLSVANLVEPVINAMDPLLSSYYPLSVDMLHTFEGI